MRTVDRILGEANPRVGRCYELAGRYVSENPEATLVHGRLVNPFAKGLKELDHAWVEEGNQIFDPVMDRWWPKDLYKAVFQAKEYQRYSHTDVLNSSLKHEHWGPWHE
jgi:hypothetical protein